VNQVEAALRQISADLEARRAAWAVVGGFAVSARTEPRFTRDVDVVILVEDDAAAEDLARSLVAAGYALQALVEQDAVGRLATVRLLSPVAGGLGVVVDLLFATAGIEAEIVAAAEKLEILPGVVVPVATAGHLVALKLLARDDASAGPGRPPRVVAGTRAARRGGRPQCRRLDREPRVRARPGAEGTPGELPRGVALLGNGRATVSAPWEATRPRSARRRCP